LTQNIIELVVKGAKRSQYHDALLGKAR